MYELKARITEPGSENTKLGNENMKFVDGPIRHSVQTVTSKLNSSNWYINTKASRETPGM
jgi:hypothetical protein